MADVLTIDDLIADKKHSTFFAEVITGKTGGLAGGADITTATNQVTGQVQKTVPAIVQTVEDDFAARVAGMAFTRVGTFTAGATLTDMRQTLLWEVSQGGDGHEYSWAGTFLQSGKVVTPSSSPTPVSAGNWVDRTEDRLRSDLNVVVKVFESVADMAADASLVVGQKCRTIGYYSGWVGTASKPKGGNQYEVVAGGTGTADEGSFISLSNGLQAKGLFSDGAVNVCQFGAKGDGVTDDTVAIQKAFDYSRHESAAIELSDNDEYYITSTLTYSSECNLHGNNATIKPSSGFPAISLSKQKHLITGKSIIVTTSTTSIPMPAEATSVQVGDVIRLTNTIEPRVQYTDAITAQVGVYYYGTIAVVTEISGGNITLSHSPSHSTTYNEIEILECMRNSDICNLNIDTRNILHGRGITGYAYNINIERCNITSLVPDSGVYGIVLSGINITCKENVVSGYLHQDGSPRLGYGIGLTGHDVKAYRNRITDCKHCITVGAERLLYGLSSEISNNYLEQTSSVSIANANPPIDSHANIGVVVIHDNYVLGRTSFAQIRNKSAHIYNNEYTQQESISGSKIILLFEDDKSDISIHNNDFHSILNGDNSLIFSISNSFDINISNVKISKNRIYNAGITYSGYSGYATTGNYINWDISDNEIYAPVHGIRLNTSGYLENINIRNNTIKYGILAYGHGVRMEVATITDKVLVDGNQFVSGSFASNSIRIATGYSGKILPRNNTMDKFIYDESGSYIFEWHNNIYTGAYYDGGHGWKGGTEIHNSYLVANSAPASGTWMVGERVYRKTPVVGQPKSWVCTVSGTPGTWVSEGNL